MSVTAIEADQVLNFYGQLEAVSTVTTTNITLSGVQDLNGATGAAGDRVFVAGQTVGTEDGIYIMDSGAWIRAQDADDDGNFVADLGSMLFIIEDGTFAGQTWKVSNARGVGVVGTDDLFIAVYFDPASVPANRVFGEEASFTTGEFTATILNTPTAGTERVYRNGSRQQEGGPNDYTISGTTLTFARKLSANTKILVDYEF